jgi:hypothetical protein
MGEVEAGEVELVVRRALAVEQPREASCRRLAEIVAA